MKLPQFLGKLSINFTIHLNFSSKLLKKNSLHLFSNSMGIVSVKALDKES